MVGTIDTVFLGVAERTSERGNKYRIVTFMDDGQPVSAMLSNDFSGKLPDTLSECRMDVHVVLGRFQKVEVIAIG